MFLPPKPWHDVQPGDVVMWAGVPRTVLGIEPVPPVYRVVYLEGIAPVMVLDFHDAYPVELDTHDAMMNLFAAGLAPEVIKEF